MIYKQKTVRKEPSCRNTRNIYVLMIVHWENTWYRATIYHQKQEKGLALLERLHLTCSKTEFLVVRIVLVKTKVFSICFVQKKVRNTVKT